MSPLERAIETAEAIARPHRLEPVRVPDLGEVRLGEWEGREIADLDRLAEWKRFNAYRSGVRPPGGEFMIEVQSRMLRAVDSICRRHDGEIVAVVSHGDPIRVLLAAYLGIPLDLQLRFEISPASVSVVEAGDWSPRVLCMNHTGDAPL